MMATAQRLPPNAGVFGDSRQVARCSRWRSRAASRSRPTCRRQTDPRRWVRLRAGVHHLGDHDDLRMSNATGHRTEPGAEGQGAGATAARPLQFACSRRASGVRTGPSPDCPSATVTGFLRRATSCPPREQAWAVAFGLFAVRIVMEGSASRRGRAVRDRPGVEVLAGDDGEDGQRRRRAGGGSFRQSWRALPYRPPGGGQGIEEKEQAAFDDDGGRYRQRLSRCNIRAQNGAECVEPNTRARPHSRDRRRFPHRRANPGDKADRTRPAHPDQRGARAA